MYEAADLLMKAPEELFGDDTQEKQMFQTVGPDFAKTLKSRFRWTLSTNLMALRALNLSHRS